MSVYKRGSVWWVRFSKAPFGEIRQSSGSTKKSDALALEVKLKEECRQRILQGKTGSPSTPWWDDAVIRFIESGAPQSWHPKLRQIRPWFDGTQLTQAPKVAMDMKGDLLKDGLSPCTINRRLAAVKRILNLAYREWHWLDKPLAERIVMCSEKGTEREVYMSEAEVKQLFDLMTPSRRTGVEVAANVKIALMLSVNTGLRESELLSLTPNNWRPPNLVIYKAKSKRPRSVPVHPVAQWIREDHLPLKVSKHQLRYWWEKARELAGMEHVRKHDLRHTFASWYLSDPTKTMHALRDIMGHANLTVTSRYAHLRSDAVPTVGVDLLAQSDGTNSS